MNSKLLKLKLCVKSLNFEEWILLILFLGSILVAAFGNVDWLIVTVFIGAYLIPVSTFANNFSNLIFLAFWIAGLIMMFFLFEEPFFSGPTIMLLLYFATKYIFIANFKRDLVFGSSSAGSISNKWLSGKSRTDNSGGDNNDKNYQMVLIFIAIVCLFLGVFNREW